MNFKVGGHGSLEFRRPPGVATAKKAKHWIAFAMTFLDMAIQFNQVGLSTAVQTASRLKEVYHPDFEKQLLTCARRLSTFPILDARLRQQDDPRSLYISNMVDEDLTWLTSIDADYGCLG